MAVQVYDLPGSAHAAWAATQEAYSREIQAGTVDPRLGLAVWQTRVARMKPTPSSLASLMGIPDSGRPFATFEEMPGLSEIPFSGSLLASREGLEATLARIAELAPSLSLEEYAQSEAITAGINARLDFQAMVTEARGYSASLQQG